MRRYVTMQGYLMRRTEAAWCPRVLLNVAVSPNDRAMLEGIAPGSRFTVVPNGVDVDYFRPEPSAQQRGIVFVGSASWFPNRDALSYFCQSILPRVRAQVPDVAVHWVGGADPGDADHIRREHGVNLMGYVPDVRPVIRDAACYVVPLRVGGGSRLKILDAWAMGKAVVSTSIGCEGLAAESGHNIVVADEPADFGDAVVRVLTDADWRSTLGSAARQTAEQTYAWDAIGQAMLPLYPSPAAHGEGTPASSHDITGRSPA